MPDHNAVSATEHILALRNYPRKSTYFMAALEDIYAEEGSIDEGSMAILCEFFQVKAPPRSMLDILFHKPAALHKPAADTLCITICTGPVCLNAGADTLAKALTVEFQNAEHIAIERQHCMGTCHSPPAVKLDDNVIGSATAAGITSRIRQTLNCPNEG